MIREANAASQTLFFRRTFQLILVVLLVVPVVVVLMVLLIAISSIVSIDRFGVKGIIVNGVMCFIDWVTLFP